MTIKITDKGPVLVNDDGTEENVFGGAEQSTGASEKPAMKFHGINIDERHPFVTFVMGVPLFSCSKILSDRATAMLANGLPLGALAVMDTRDGAIHMVQVK